MSQAELLLGWAQTRPQSTFHPPKFANNPMPGSCLIGKNSSKMGQGRKNGQQNGQTMDAKIIMKSGLSGPLVTDGRHSAPHRSSCRPLNLTQAPIHPLFADAARAPRSVCQVQAAYGVRTADFPGNGAPLTMAALERRPAANVTVEELSRRKNDWKPREHGYGAGALWKYAQQAGPAVSGAVTHPGGSHEGVCYADI